MGELLDNILYQIFSVTGATLQLCTAVVHVWRSLPTQSLGSLKSISCTVLHNSDLNCAAQCSNHPLPVPNNH
eukprot:1795939-Amphidinium_carterae.1